MKITAVILFLFYTLHTKYSAGQSYKNLVFEGAGIRGIAYAGAIEALEQEGILKHIDNVGGTSAGAITAMMISLGYTSYEIATIIGNTKFQQFNDGRFFFFGGIARMRNSFGWYRGEKFLSWLEDLIEAKTGDKHITLSQLKDKGFKSFYATATNLNQQKLIILSASRYPDMRLSDAVRISMSVPLYFKAVFVDKNGQVYPNQKKNKEVEIFVDGGITGNFPIHIFDDSIDRLRVENPETIGFRIDDSLQIIKDQGERDLVSQKIRNLPQYLSAFYILSIEHLNRNHLTEKDWQRTVSISSAGITPRVKRMSALQKEKLITGGRQATLNWLAERRPIQ